MYRVISAEENDAELSILKNLEDKLKDGYKDINQVLKRNLFTDSRVHDSKDSGGIFHSYEDSLYDTEFYYYTDFSTDLNISKAILLSLPELNDEILLTVFAHGQVDLSIEIRYPADIKEYEVVNCTSSNLYKTVIGYATKCISDYLGTTSEYEEEDYDEDYEDYWNSPKSEDDGVEFVEKVTDILEKEYPGADVFEEPSVQGHMGSDFWTITMKDGTEYSVEFDFDQQTWDIFDEGVSAASKDYAQRIINKIKSGEALVED